MKLLRFFCIFLFCQELYADEPLLLAEMGYGRINLEQGYRITETTSSFQNIAVLGFLLGYKFESHFLIMAGANDYSGWGEFDGSDSADVSESTVLIGYAININASVRVVPMLGLSRWKFTATEGAFLNPGPEEERVYRGNDKVGKIILEFPSIRKFGLNVSYTHGKYDFGVLQSLRFGVHFKFMTD